MQGFEQSRAARGQLRTMVNDQFAYHFFPGRCEDDQHFTAIAGPALAPN
jgi:hypothetical protein